METKLNDNVQNIALSEITPYNGSHNTDMVVSMIKESLDKFGVQQPLILDTNKVIVAGNAIYRAAQELGWSEIPCIILDNLTEEQIAQYRIADNKTSEFARWNEKKLKQELSYLQSPSDLQFCFDQKITGMLGMDIVPQFKKVEQPKKEEGQKSVQQQNQDFKQKLQEEERSLEAKPREYYTFICSKCGKEVRIKK